MRESGFSSWLNGRRFIRAVIAGVTALSFVLPPLAPAMAQSLTADPSGSTSIKAAPNGVPVVDIAGANGAGVSRNLYTDFNVGEKGLIFNNATGVTPSQLAGLLQANDKLGGRSASLILNEVTGANPSTLLGYMEIIGGRADLVVANPNGITCRGCGFINTPRATLSTGRAKLDPATGAFLGLDVEGGTVTIEQTNKGDGNDFGVDARQVDYFDIVAGLIMLDGAVYGKDVGLFGGAQDFDYASRTATAKAGSNLDDIVIDSSLLGGAYANRITLVGSGGGVKTPHEMKAAFGGISLTADGKIVFGKAAAEGAIKATSKSGSIEVAQDISVWSETALELTANKGTITLFDGATAGAKGDVTLKASSLDVRRDALLASGLDEFGQMSLAGLLTIEVAALANAGTIGAKEDVTITISGYGSNNGQIIAGGTLALMGGGTFSNEARGTLSGDTQVSINLGRFFNAGVLTSANGEMLIATAGNISNSGDIQSAGKLTMSLLGDLTNSGKLTSQTELGVTARNIRNTGELYSSGILSVLARSLLTNERRGVISGDGGVHLAAARFVNKGLAGSAKANLSADIAGSIQNYGLLYGRQDILLRLDGTLLNDKADIIAQNNLTVAGLTKRRANALTNVSGWIEATSGDLTIRADNVVNKRPRIVVEKRVKTSTSGGVSKKITTEYFNKGASGQAGFLLAGRDLTINAVSITNEASLIAANRDIILTGSKLSNEGRDLTRTTHSTWTEWRYYKKRRWWGGTKKKWYRVHRHSTSVDTVGALSGTIQAGRNFRGSFTGQINNKSIRQNAGPTSALGRGSLSDLSKLDGDASIAASAGALVARALFVESGNPKSGYVIETRPEFLDISQYIGTDLLLAGLGILPSNANKRLGDAYVETRLILEQLFATAGLRLLPGFNSVAEMMEALLQNALYLQKELGLTVGQALTQAQINALNKDIVWLVPQKFRGQTVWAPKLYLSDKTLKKIDRIGAQIVAGSDLDLEAPEISNSGALKAGQDIKIAGTDFKTRAGLVRGGRDLNINVADNFKNVSSTIEGRNVNINAKNISNEREAIRYQYGNGNFRDEIGREAKIKASENLSVTAAEDITSKGGSFEAGTDAALNAGRHFNNLAQQLYSDQTDRFKKGYHRVTSIKNIIASVSAGGKVDIEAGGDAGFAGSKVTSGAGTRVHAYGNIFVAAVQDSTQTEFRVKDKGGFFSGKVDIERNEAKSSTLSSVFNSGAELDLTAEKGSIGLQAAKLLSEGETTLSADNGQVALLTAKDSEFFHEKKHDESLVWFNTRDQGHYKESVVHTKIKADGGLTIKAGGGVIAEYHATGDLNASIAQLSKSPGLSWMAELKNRDDVQWNAVKAEYEQWDHKSQGLTEAGAALVALAVTAASAGTLGSLAGSMASAFPAGIQPAMTAAFKAGLTSLATRASVSLINNQGDLGAVFKELGSSASLRSLAVAMVTAGLTVGATDALGLGGDIPVNASLTERVTGNLQENLVRASISSAVDSAISGADFDKALLSQLRYAGVSTVLSATQTAIGDLTDGVGAKDLPVANMLAHAVAGGLAAEALGGEFAEGAASALASSVAANAGLFDGLDAKEISAVSQLIGGVAGLVAGGDGKAVTQGAHIAQSAALNNYLTHKQIKQFEKELRQCGGDRNCQGSTRRKFYDLHKQNSKALEACGTDNACVTRHLTLIADASELARSTEVTGGPKYHNGEPLYSVHNFFQQADIRHAIAVYRTNVKLEKACPGLGASCVSRERTKILGKELANLALDFTPIVGDGKAFWDAYKSGSAIDWGAAIVGIAPLAGDGLGKLLKGGKRKNVDRADLDEFKTEQKRLPAPEKRLALPKPDNIKNSGPPENKVYRALREGENPKKGLNARSPGANVSVGSHVMGKKHSDLISTTVHKNKALGSRNTKPLEGFNSGHGVVEIDLNKVDTPIIDASKGIGGGRVRTRTKSHGEVFIRDNTDGTKPAISADAITVIEEPTK